MTAQFPPRRSITDRRPRWTLTYGAPVPGVGVGIVAPGVTGGDCRVSEELPVTAGPMTKADRANMAVNTAMAMVGAVQAPKR